MKASEAVNMDVAAFKTLQAEFFVVDLLILRGGREAISAYTCQSPNLKTRQGKV